jgi:hypothetical protein
MEDELKTVSSHTRNHVYSQCLTAKLPCLKRFSSQVEYTLVVVSERTGSDTFVSV